MKDLLDNYWPQITLVLSGVGGLIFYFIKRFFDLKSSKVEISYKMFQEYRLQAVACFFQEYSKTERFWDSFRIYDAYQKKIDVNEMDALIVPHQENLKNAIFTLSIYFSIEDMIIFNELVKEIELINKTIKKGYFDLEQKEPLIHKVNRFTEVTDNVKVNNKLRFENINIIIQTTFNVNL